MTFEIFHQKLADAAMRLERERERERERKRKKESVRAQARKREHASKKETAREGASGTLDALNCRSFFAKEPIIIRLFCAKWPIKIRHPMGLCHPICVPQLRMLFQSTHEVSFIYILFPSYGSSPPY